MGVVVRRYIDILTIIINFPYILHLYYLFLAAASVLLCSFLNCFLLFNIYIYIYIYIYINILVNATALGLTYQPISGCSAARGIVQ